MPVRCERVVEAGQRPFGRRQEALGGGFISRTEMELSRLRIAFDLLEALAEEVPADRQPQQHCAKTAKPPSCRRLSVTLRTPWTLPERTSLATTSYYAKPTILASGIAAAPSNRALLSGRAQHIARIAAIAPDAEIVDAGQERVAIELLEADIFCGHAKVPVPWDDVVRKGRLKWIQSSAAGMDHCLVPSVIGSDITVTSASGVLADQVADHTVALLRRSAELAHVLGGARKARIHPPANARFAPRTDRHRRTRRNGRRLAEVLSVFRTTILATDWFPENKPARWRSCCPLTRSTHVAAGRDSDPGRAAQRSHAAHDRRSAARSVAAGAILINMARGRWLSRTISRTPSSRANWRGRAST